MLINLSNNNLQIDKLPKQKKARLKKLDNTALKYIPKIF